MFARLRRKESVGIAALLLLLLVAAFTANAQDVAARREPYRIAAGDLIEIRVFGQPDFSVEMRVPPEGTVSYPGIEGFPLLGRAVREAEEDLTRRLREGGFLVKPIVSVLVKEFAARTVYVIGRVREPGEYAIPVGRELLLSHALSMAKGFTEDADLARVLVIRRASGREERFDVDFRAVENGPGSERNLVLQVADQIVVPELRSAYVIGEVNRPGEIALPADGTLSVSRVLSLAGGFNERSADLSEVKIYRRGSAGTLAIEVDVKAHLDGKARDIEPSVQPDDLVYVPRRGVL